MVLVMVDTLAMAGTVGAMVEDTTHNPAWPTKGNARVTVWVRAALPLELGLVSSAECFWQTPLTISEIVVRGTCFTVYASSMTVVNALLTRL